MTSTQGPIPGLVMLGEPTLMRRQDEVDVRSLGNNDFGQRLGLLHAAMVHYGGIGIAAPQIGWNARVFCLGAEATSSRYPGLDAIAFGYWINPRIVSYGSRTTWAWEGCLSVPGLRGWVERSSAIEVEGLDEHGAPQHRHLEGFEARIFQHEYDHLDGILYPSRVEKTRWLVSDALLEHRDRWDDHYPSAGARQTPLGAQSDEA